MESIEEKLKQLPQDLQNEVNDFIEFLLTKRMAKKKKKPMLDWIGGLKEYRDQFTGLELQKKSLDWRD